MILMTWHIWDTDYNSDNWKTEFITIFVAWQLRVTLDSIRNSCDVSRREMKMTQYRDQEVKFFENFQEISGTSNGASTLRCFDSGTAIRYSKSHVEAPFEVPGDKIWDQNFQV